MLLMQHGDVCSPDFWIWTVSVDDAWLGGSLLPLCEGSLNSTGNCFHGFQTIENHVLICSRLSWLLALAKRLGSSFDPWISFRWLPLFSSFVFLRHGELEGLLCQESHLREECGWSSHPSATYFRRPDDDETAASLGGAFCARQGVEKAPRAEAQAQARRPCNGQGDGPCGWAFEKRREETGLEAGAERSLKWVVASWGWPQFFCIFFGLEFQKATFQHVCLFVLCLLAYSLIAIALTFFSRSIVRDGLRKHCCVWLWQLVLGLWWKCFCFSKVRHVLICFGIAPAGRPGGKRWRSAKTSLHDRGWLRFFRHEGPWLEGRSSLLPTPPSLASITSRHSNQQLATITSTTTYNHDHGEFHTFNTCVGLGIALTREHYFWKASRHPTKMKQVRKWLIHTFLQVGVPEECLPAASFTESKETTTWQNMIDTLQSWMQKASAYVCAFRSTVLDLVKSLVLSLGIILEVFRVTLEDIIRKCRDCMKAPRLQVNRDSRTIGLWLCGVASFASLA